MQNDTSTKNLRVLTQTALEYGAYPAGSYQACTATPACDVDSSPKDRAMLQEVPSVSGQRIRPGVCFPWEQRVKELPEITGKPELIQKIWEDIDAFGNMYIWQLLLSF